MKRIDQILGGLLIAVGMTTLVIASLEIIRIKSAHPSMISDLPINNTIAAYEWTIEDQDQHIRFLHKHLTLPQVYSILELDQNFLVRLEFLDENPRQKMLSLMWVKEKPAAIISYKINSTTQDLKNSEGFFTTTKNGNLHISTDADAIDLIDHPYKSIAANDWYLEAQKNTPKNNFANFYINHSNLNSYLNKTGLNIVAKQLENFAVTYGSIRADRDGVFISSYTNFDDDSDFQIRNSGAKYGANLIPFLPKDYDIAFGGQNLSGRFLNLIDQNFDPQKTPKQIQSFLTKYNLDNSAVDLFKEALSKEYALAFYDGNPFLVTESNSSEKWISVLSRLAAYFNPKTISYTLEDKSVARQLVPAEKYEPIKIRENIYEFELGELNISLFLMFKEEKVYLSNSVELLKKAENAKRIPLKKGIRKILDVADETIDINPKFIFRYLKNYLDERDIPEVTSAFNYFKDGIQTVHFLKW